MENFISLLVNNGVAVAVVVYFFWKDATLTKENSEILQQVKALLSCLVDENKEVYYCPSAKGKLINSVGSGDSMVAGFVAGYLKNHDYKEALKLGSACGGATAFSEDLAQLDLIKEVEKQLTVEKIS